MIFRLSHYPERKKNVSIIIRILGLWIGTWSKLLTQMSLRQIGYHFLQATFSKSFSLMKIFEFKWNFTEICPVCLHLCCSGGGLVLNRQLGITWTYDVQFRCIVLDKNLCVLIQIPVCSSKRPIDNKPSLFHVMAWCLIGDKPLPDRMMTRFIDAYIYHWASLG